MTLPSPLDKHSAGPVRQFDSEVATATPGTGRIPWQTPSAIIIGWALVLIGLGLLSYMASSGDAVNVSQVISAIVAVSVMVGGGCTVLWRWGFAPGRERRKAIIENAIGTAGHRLRPLGSVDVTDLGVRVPRRHATNSNQQLPYARRNKLDQPLLDALREHRFVVVHGPSASGKSRSTAEHARGMYGDRLVVVPIGRPDALNTLLSADAIPDTAIVWLDDLDRHIASGVHASLLQRILEIPATRIIATIRAAAYEQIKPQDELRAPGRDILDMLHPHAFVAFSGWDQDDREGAAAQYIDQPDVVAALRTGMGLGEYLAAGPDLVERLEQGSPPASGVALVCACADWYRAGMARPTPLGLARTLYPSYLPEDDATLLDQFAEALTWACTPVSGARILTQRTDRTGLAVHDYVLDRLSVQLPPGLPQSTWDAIAAELHDRPADLVDVARTAFVVHQDPVTAERLARTAAAQGSAAGEFAVGYLLAERSELEEAERSFRAAAQAGNTNAMHNLGVLLAERGDIEEAERWYGIAVEAGFTTSMFNLGVLWKDRGDAGKAERWFRTAISAGNTTAMHALGKLLDERGDFEAAERWYRTAIAADNVRAMNSLGVLLAEHGDSKEAENWYRTAVAAGNSDAMHNLGVMLKERGDAKEAELWWRTAAAEGNADSMNNLGALLNDRGHDEEAMHWWRMAVAAGNATAVVNMGNVFNEQGDAEEAERCYRAAADGNHTKAMDSLATLLKNRGADVEAERWWRTAAAAGEAESMNNLGVLLHERGDTDEAKVWCRAAAERGLPIAAHNLGNVFYARGDTAGAERWWRAAAEAGEWSAANNLGNLLHERGDSTGAERWWRAAAEAGDQSSMKNLEAFRTRLPARDDIES